ncbi:MAG: hypothetical protein A3E01_09065 [Gammaproteobacteria bacterium RIFCSPHIGHO2_12_FULL_63_22]|nr:MAG: hypothetical protein A3E01_09065 [Gammaproteobacteria bacterium RIFCSPHIGHO2_12_FULL_63_22]
MTPTEALLAHIRALVDADTPFDGTRVAKAFGKSRSTITGYLRELSIAGMIEIDRRHYHQTQVTRVTVIGHGSTPWPALNDAVRADVVETSVARLTAWMDRNGWSQNQLARGISMVRGAGFNSAAISKFIGQGECSPSVKQDIAGFIDTYPRAGSFEAWFARYNATRNKVDDDEIQRRRDEVERERVARRRALLANERRPWKRADNDDFDLDAATIRALSGGTIGRLGHG